jgi:hypothetical protein
MRAPLFNSESSPMTVIALRKGICAVWSSAGGLDNKRFQPAALTKLLQMPVVKNDTAGAILEK